MKKSIFLLIISILFYLESFAISDFIFSDEKSVKISANNYSSKDLYELQKLEPFEDIAVIQRKYLPKTRRFELFAGGTSILNDAFFTSWGFFLFFNFYFSEPYGVEGHFMFLDTIERNAAKDLRTNMGVIPEQNFVTPVQFQGVSLKWNPIYGKMAYLNEGIIYYDFYFSGGFGLTKTSQDNMEPTLRLGTGQIFSFSKDFALRWDLSLYYYKARIAYRPQNFDGTYGDERNIIQTQNNLYLAIGFCYFFPEARYR